ncbi:nucleoside phosphorylase domain-containing protein [Aspergillus terricola var. indicus]
MAYSHRYPPTIPNRRTNRAGRIKASGHASVHLGNNHYRQEESPQFHADRFPLFTEFESCTVVATDDETADSAKAPLEEESGSDDIADYSHVSWSSQVVRDGASETPTSPDGAQMALSSLNAPFPPPQDRTDFDVAIFCALPLEADAVETLFDRRLDTFIGPIRYRKAPGDPNAYTTGSIGRHNVVLVHMPGIGKSHGAAAAAWCRASFPSIRLALVVGICGGAPCAADWRVIRLGDVVISDGLVQFDFGRMHGSGFVRKDTLLDNLGRPSTEIRAVLARLKGKWGQELLRDRIAGHFSVLVKRLGEGYVYPPGSEPDEPTIHIGLVASGDQVMRSDEVRDSLINREGVIAFEMEGAGVWDTFPSLVIKGVADYADCHKNKEWQNYAAATAAACAKAFLELWT